MADDEEGDDEEDSSMGDPPFLEKYRLEEFKSLRKEIERYLVDMRSTERYVLIADAAIYGVLAFPSKESVADTTAVNIAWWLPAIIGALGMMRWRENLQMVFHIADYIRRNEPNQSGWETFLENRRQEMWLTNEPLWYAVFWTIVIGGPSAIAIYKKSFWADDLCLAVVSGALIAVIAGLLAYLRLPARLRTFLKRKVGRGVRGSFDDGPNRYKSHDKDVRSAGRESGS